MWWIALVVVAVVALVVFLFSRGDSRAPFPAQPPSDAAVRALVQAGRKIEAIKMVRELHGLGLKEAKDWVESGMAGELSARRVPQAGMAPGRMSLPSTPLEDSEVMALVRSGRRIEAIKVARERYGLGLKDAKDWVESA
jgi:ribosomal protein L7/L12